MKLALLSIFLALPLAGGGIQCSATCLSKIASGVSIAANGKSIIAGAKKVRHPKRKSTKSTKGTTIK